MNMRLLIYFFIAALTFSACSSDDSKQDNPKDNNEPIVAEAKITRVDNRAVPGGLLYIKGQGFVKTDKILMSATSKSSEPKEATFAKIENNGAWIQIPENSETGSLTLTLVREDARQELGNVEVRVSSLYGVRGENGKNILVKIDTTDMSEKIINNNFKEMEYLSYIPETHEIIGWVYDDVTYDSHCEIYSFEKNSFKKLELPANITGGMLAATGGRIYGGSRNGLYSVTMEGKDERCEYKWEVDPELFVYMPLQNCIIAAGEFNNGTNQYASKIVIHSLSDKKTTEHTIEGTVWSMCPVNNLLYYVTTSSALLNNLNVLDVTTGITEVVVTNTFELDANMIYLESRNELIGTPMDELTNDESMMYLFKYNIGTKHTSKINNTKYYWELIKD